MENVKNNGVKLGLYDTQWMNCVNDPQVLAWDTSKEDAVNRAVELAEKYCIENAKKAIAAAEQAQQAEPVAKAGFDAWFAAQQFEIPKLYWNEIVSMLKDAYCAAPPAVAVPTIKLGLYGRAFDSPQTRRAYTYREQPDNIGAYKLGRAVLRAASGGDSIDYGLSLLKQLQAEGFGVFELGDQQEGGA